MPLIIKYKKEPGATPPSYTCDGNVSFDIFSNEEKIVESKYRTLIKTGLYLEIPKGYVGLLYDKNEIALKQGLHIISNLLDSNYKGELKVVIVNLSSKPIKIEKGAKIAQLLIQKVENVLLKEIVLPNEKEKEQIKFDSSIQNYNRVLRESEDNIKYKEKEEDKRKRKAKDDFISEIKSEIESKPKTNKRKIVLKHGLKEVKSKIKR